MRRPPASTTRSVSATGRPLSSRTLVETNGTPSRFDKRPSSCAPQRRLARPNVMRRHAQECLPLEDRTEVHTVVRRIAKRRIPQIGNDDWSFGTRPPHQFTAPPQTSARISAAASADRALRIAGDQDRQWPIGSSTLTINDPLCDNRHYQNHEQSNGDQRRPRHAEQPPRDTFASPSQDPPGRGSQEFTPIVAPAVSTIQCTRPSVT